MLASPTTNWKLERIDGGNKKYSGEIERGSEGPGEDLGIEILADVEGGSVDGLRPELLLVRPEFGLRLDGGLERVRRREVGLDAGVDAEAEGIVGLADLPLHAAARHRRCCCSFLSLPGRKA